MRCNVNEGVIYEGVIGDVSASRSTHTGGIDPQAASASQAQRSLHTDALTPWKSKVGVSSHIGGPWSGREARGLLKDRRRKTSGFREVKTEDGSESIDEPDRRSLLPCA